MGVQRKNILQVSHWDIFAAVFWGVVKDGLLEKGYTLYKISFHIILAGVSMELNIM